MDVADTTSRRFGVGEAPGQVRERAPRALLDLDVGSLDNSLNASIRW